MGVSVHTHLYTLRYIEGMIGFGEVLLDWCEHISAKIVFNYMTLTRTVLTGYIYSW